LSCTHVCVLIVFHIAYLLVVIGGQEIMVVVRNMLSFAALRSHVWMRTSAKVLLLGVREVFESTAVGKMRIWQVLHSGVVVPIPYIKRLLQVGLEIKCPVLIHVGSPGNPRFSSAILMLDMIIPFVIGVVTRKTLMFQTQGQIIKGIQNRYITVTKIKYV
jgi:hypothetical protein